MLQLQTLLVSLLASLATCQPVLFPAQLPLLRGAAASSKAADDEPLLKPEELATYSQISPGTQKVPMQLVLTSKREGGKELPAGVRSNIIHTLAMDPQIRVRWLDDDSCVAYLEKHFQSSYADMLRKEKRGSFRGDICRAAVLYREGGFYTDLDLELRVPLTKVIDTTTTFMSCFTADNAILNAIVAAAPRNPVMKETLKELRKWYNGEALQSADFSADGTTSEWMGPLTMLRGLKSAIRKECQGQEVSNNMQLRTKCGQQEFMLYREAELDCMNAPSDECPQSRATAEFMGVRFGMFEMKPEDPSFRRLIGWPRFDGCTDWGCQSGGWDESDMSAATAAGKEM